MCVCYYTHVCTHQTNNLRLGGGGGSSDDVFAIVLEHERLAHPPTNTPSRNYNAQSRRTVSVCISEPGQGGRQEGDGGSLCTIYAHI